MMRTRETWAAVVCCTAIVLLSQDASGKAKFETQIKTVVVLDNHGLPVPDARVYQGECLTWDNKAQATRLAAVAPWKYTDATGSFSFEFVRQGSGRSYLIVDASLEKMKHLYISRKDPTETYQVQLEKPAHITGTIKREDVGFSDVYVKYAFYNPEKRTAWPLFSGVYRFETPVHEMTLDLLCPAECHLNLSVGLEDKPVLKESIEVSPQQSGQVFKFGSIAIPSISGSRVVGMPAPKLQIGEWIKGVKGRAKPATMGALKTSHFERMICQGFTPNPTMSGFQECLHGESTQDGYGRNNMDAQRAWLVPAADC